jgi:hypothetical protein
MVEAGMMRNLCSTTPGSGSRSRGRLRAGSAGAWMLLAAIAFAGPVQALSLGWAVGPGRLEVVDLPTGTLRAAFDAPAGVTFFPGVLTPDGRYYLLPTSQGVLRFRGSGTLHTRRRPRRTR